MIEFLPNLNQSVTQGSWVPVSCGRTLPLTGANLINLELHSDVSLSKQRIRNPVSVSMITFWSDSQQTCKLGSEKKMEVQEQPPSTCSLNTTYWASNFPADVVDLRSSSIWPPSFDSVCHYLSFPLVALPISLWSVQPFVLSNTCLIILFPSEPKWQLSSFTYFVLLLCHATFWKKEL